MEPNWDFRTWSIYPTYDEVVGDVKAPIKANIVDGPFKSVEQYLETHFWLMREEVVGPLRQKVDQIKRNRGNVECPPYMTAQFLRSNGGHEKSKGYKLKFTNVQASSDKDTAELQSQSLMHGSLVCFTCNSFETLLFATISYQDKNFMEKSQVFVKFHSEFKEDIFRKEYIMIESETFFWPYAQVLQVIQRTEENDFPFPQYFIEVSKSDALPKYMRNSSTTISIEGVDQDFTSVRLLEPNSWPTAAEIGLDESQLISLQAALTRELTFILGPPGTGKTYVGLTVAQILIENKAALNLKKPILVVSDTNHSLDRFLIELLNLTNNFVRIGQQSKFPKLNTYNYNKLEGTWSERLACQDVIGMTVSKASEWRPKLTALGCEVVIVEDASVIFDAQLFACLPKNCQHLVMIGGEKLLQPKLKNPDLASFQLNVSFFKRMIDNRESQKPLRFQYRMPPEMTKLISPLIYPEMKHNAKVLSLPVLELLPNRVSFVTHNYPESGEEIEVRTPEQIMKKQWKTGNSKKNDQEASFAVALCKYLLLQKVAPLDVTILTTYSCQSELIKKLIKGEKSKVGGLASVHIATVDNFQGGENKFIILSLVRSNSCGALGYLEEEHRIGVALSKAQNALIIVGNMATLTLSSKSSIWRSIRQTLDEQDCFGSRLELRLEFIFYILYARPTHQGSTWSLWRS
ncbi:NFX1-type zinc finger-containing protein 1-like isoform X2 [Cloeon dipterum]|uniref:NFX1-type zinc finger-containing protein 1-like isoform X2 n=1 Tax=Cloeon dipterum TaxID=197152 RepID=UPI00321FAD25